MTTFQLFDSDGNHLEGIQIEADSARDACRLYRAGYHVLLGRDPAVFRTPSLDDVQAVNLTVPNDSPIRHAGWHGDPDYMPSIGGRTSWQTLDTTDYHEGRCAKYCVKCDALIRREDVTLAMDEPERCVSCGDDAGAVAVLHMAVHNPDGERTALVGYAEEAACLMSFYGDGASIRVAGRIVWQEGKEDQPAAESYDHVAETVARRQREARRS